MTSTRVFGFEAFAACLKAPPAHDSVSLLAKGLIHRFGEGNLRSCGSLGTAFRLSEIRHRKHLEEIASVATVATVQLFVGQRSLQSNSATQDLHIRRLLRHFCMLIVPVVNASSRVACLKT